MDTLEYLKHVEIGQHDIPLDLANSLVVRFKLIPQKSSLIEIPYERGMSLKIKLTLSKDRKSLNVADRLYHVFMGDSSGIFKDSEKAIESLKSYIETHYDKTTGEK